MKKFKKTDFAFLLCEQGWITSQMLNLVFALLKDFFLVIRTFKQP